MAMLTRGAQHLCCVVIIFLVGFVGNTGGLSCPFKPKMSMPEANQEKPTCTADTPKVKERQAKLDSYCQHYQFKNNGTGDQVCITAQDQYVTSEQRACAGVFETRCMGPLAQLIGRYVYNIEIRTSVRYLYMIFIANLHCFFVYVYIL